MNDPVVRDLNAYLREEDRRDAYQDEIYRRAVNLSDNEPAECLSEIYSDDKLTEEFTSSVGVISACRSEASRKLACDDMSAIMFEAAKRIAVRQFAAEMQKAAEELAYRRWCKVCGSRVSEVA